MERYSRPYVFLAKNMNWYKIFRIAQLRGEFWLASGQALFADGNIGDYNHEGYVIEQVQNQYKDNDRLSWDEWQIELAKDYAERNNVQGMDEEEILLAALKETGISDEEYEIAEGRGDARLFAIKNWGWKRVLGTNIETWTISAGDMRELANGLWDAYGEDVEKATFDIHVLSNNKWYNDVPDEVLSVANPMKLRDYDSQLIRNAQTYQDILDNPKEYYGDDTKSNNAHLYFSIGQNEETIKESFSWLWDGRKLIVGSPSKTTSTPTHNMLVHSWGLSAYPDHYYRGWYDPVQKLLSFVPPPNLLGINSEDKIPSVLRRELRRKFGNDFEIKIF